MDTRVVRLALSLILAASLLPAAAGAQTAATDSGPRLRIGVQEISINGRVQTQFNTTSVDGEQPSEVILRRVRLEAAVKVNDLVSGKVQPDFAGNRVSLKDAYLRLSFSPAFQLLAGQAYRPFSLLTQTSSTRILPIERGAEIRGLAAAEEQILVSDLAYAERDIGLQLTGAPRGAPLGLSYAAGIFRGPLHGRVGPQDSYQFAARLGVQPAAQLRLAAAWSSRDFEAPGGTEEEPELERGNAFEVDVEYGGFSAGPHLMAEFATGDVDPVTDTRFYGASAWLAYRTRPLARIGGVEPLFRASYGDFDQEDGAATLGLLPGTLVTPGINVYFGGLNRLMLNYDVWLPDEGDTEQSVKVQFQLAF